MSLVTMLKNKKVTFVKYFDGDLWYTTECGYHFPVPISEAGSTEFLAEDKAMLFMRYVRKHQARVTA
jgi:hypothetical protein